MRMKTEPSKYDYIREQVQEIRQQAVAQADAAKSAAAKIELAVLDVLDKVNALEDETSDCVGCWCHTCANIYCCPHTPLDYMFNTHVFAYPCTQCKRGGQHKPIENSRCKDYERRKHECENCLCYTCALLTKCPHKPDGARGWFAQDRTLWPCEHCPEDGVHCWTDSDNKCRDYSKASFGMAEV